MELLNLILTCQLECIHIILNFLFCLKDCFPIVLTPDKVIRHAHSGRRSAIFRRRELLMEDLGQCQLDRRMISKIKLTLTI